jgi:hypothetical protein
VASNGVVEIEKPAVLKLHEWKEARIAEQTATSFLNRYVWFIEAKVAHYSDGDMRVKIRVAKGTSPTILKSAVPKMIASVPVLVEEA